MRSRVKWNGPGWYAPIDDALILISTNRDEAPGSGPQWGWGTPRWYDEPEQGWILW